jgi:hypothetical protein
VSSVRTILASLFTVLGGFCLLALTIGAGFAIYFWTITDSVSAPAEPKVASRQPTAKAEVASPVQSAVPSFAPVALAQSAQTPPSTNSVNSSETLRATPALTGSPNAAPAPVESAENTSAMLTRAWAPAAMLTPPKEATTPPSATVVSDAAAPNFNRPNSVLANNDQTATEPQPSPALPASAHFEGGTALPPAKVADPSVDPTKPSPDDQSTQPVKTKKTKTARRRPAKDETVETTISKGFDSLQRSISSMF